MRKSFNRAAFALAALLLVAASASAQQNHKTDWSLFSEALVDAVESGNYGAKLGAIQQIAIYGSKLQVNRTVFDVVRVYRDSKNENERILALSALAKMRDHWAMDFLSRSVRFEKSARVKHHTIDVVNAYRLGTDIPAELAAWEAQMTPPAVETFSELLALK